MTTIHPLNPDYTFSNKKLDQYVAFDIDDGWVLFDVYFEGPISPKSACEIVNSWHRRGMSFSYHLNKNIVGYDSSPNLNTTVLDVRTD